MLPLTDDGTATDSASPPNTSQLKHNVDSPSRNVQTTPEIVAPDLDSEFDEDADEETRIKFLTTGTRDQDDLERDISRQADQMLTEQADERDKKRMNKTEAEIRRCQAAISKLRSRLVMPAVESAKLKIRGEITQYQKKIDEFDEELDSIQQRINDRHKSQLGGEDIAMGGINHPLPNESRRDFLIRTGKITPFSKLAQAHRGAPSSLSEVMLDAEVENLVEEQLYDKPKGPVSHRNLMKPGFRDSRSSSEALSPPSRPTKRRRITPGRDESSSTESPTADSEDAFVPGMDDRELAALGDSEHDSDQLSGDDEYDKEPSARKRKAGSRRTNKKIAKAEKVTGKEVEDLAGIDDGNEKVYQSRIQAWTENRSAARRRARERQGVNVDEDEEDEEFHKPHPTELDVEFDGGFRIPGDIFPALFDYQKTGVEWLCELHAQGVGGIVGDEMGLGKTIQAISFIAGLHYSKKLGKPVIVVCPATVMKQWVNEFHTWWPALRVSILHTSGSGMLDTSREERMEQEMELRDYGHYDTTLTKAGKAAKKIVEKVKRDGHVLVTTYSGLQTYAEFLIPTEWECAFLDEGHKIRNPNTSITIHCKELRTPNRIILSGTPMQNNLTELWSLFDFVFPMRLGTLVNFRAQFEFPIKRGGYANASNLEVETGMRTAETLRDAISPYLLQRFKADVAADLPEKTERVLFCKLTRQQRQAYEMFLNSSDMKSIIDGRRQMLFGIDYLRKVCNHPDLTQHKTLSKDPTYNYGAGSKSGKMQVVKALLEMWKKGGHKTLLFAQHRIMLDILEKFIKNLPSFNYRRMDGETPIKNRQSMVDEFNNDPDLHVFLLTTKVGGLGVNLTGANRVIIYDPDWNPSTDIQARERSWRLGQKREVEIYRLMTAGTIEEKIYHRQIFKQFLTNKVLKDPKQRQTFQMSDLHDLFSFGTDAEETETATLFRGSEVKFKNEPTLNHNAMPNPPSDSPNGKGKQPVSVSNATAQEDLATVVGIHHTEKFQAPGEDEDEDKQNGAEDSEKSDERLLSTIFARSGVHSALEHDAIMNSTASGRKRKVQVDPAFIQREAKRAAAEAAEQLRRAREEAMNVPIGVPTWTGTYGEAGRPQQHRPRGDSFSSSGRGGRGGALSARGGPSSSSILSNLAARQARTDPNRFTSNSRVSTPGTTSMSRSGTPTPRGKQMLEMIRDFMLTHGGTVPTQMLVDHFDRYCRGVPGRSDEFREMLRTIARLERTQRSARGGGGRGRWVLKEEWRDLNVGQVGGARRART
ncbi:DNA repair protein-like protein Rhp26/Rad26 [Lindgomyces ingoldianus]|uniref:DNA repair protein-like protein Rhp26/Rad26 n=1 Tax=Lindgomyces ingoldianus TaxID=673940 RepID=A0ACB6QCI3_9PLEO|nr:DNA repair protein-like protein Rhp26/Rad26 [Lindgomyces ingoldianus]KAF2464689.1 DNA repair protein-like protein Rhp26/Rad26 [Lindgomyces ingoldianus]